MANESYRGCRSSQALPGTDVRLAFYRLPGGLVEEIQRRQGWSRTRCSGAGSLGGKEEIRNERAPRLASTARGKTVAVSRDPWKLNRFRVPGSLKKIPVHFEKISPQSIVDDSNEVFTS